MNVSVIPIVIGALGGIGDQRNNRVSFDYNTVKISLYISKNPGNLRRLAVTLTI